MGFATSHLPANDEDSVCGWYVSDLRKRCDADLIAECSRTSCLEPEVQELARFVLALLDERENDARISAQSAETTHEACHRTEHDRHAEEGTP